MEGGLPKKDGFCTKGKQGLRLVPMFVSLANHEPSTMYLNTSLLQGTSREHWPNGDIGDELGYASQA